MDKPPSTDELVSKLWSFPAFRAMEAADLEALCAGAEVREYVPGATVLEQGAPGREAVLLLEGLLAAKVESDGEEIRVGDCRPGEIVGESALLVADRPCNATVYAAAWSRCMVLPADLMTRGTPQARAAIERCLVESLAGRIRSTNKTIRSAWEDKPLADSLPPVAAGPARTTLRTRLRALFTRGNGSGS